MVVEGNKNKWCWGYREGVKSLQAKAKRAIMITTIVIILLNEEVINRVINRYIIKGQSAIIIIYSCKYRVLMGTLVFMITIHFKNPGIKVLRAHPSSPTPVPCSCPHLDNKKGEIVTARRQNAATPFIICPFLPSSRQLPGQRLPTTRALRVKIRPLAQADGAAAGTLAEVEVAVVGRGRVVDAAVVPDGEIIRIPPAQADLQVVVLDDEADEPVEEVARLVVAEPVDALHVVAHGEDGPPPRHRVRADHRVHGLEHVADVLGRAALRRVQGEPVGVGRVLEARLRVVRRQRVQEAPERLGDAVVHLVARGPERVFCRRRVLATDLGSKYAQSCAISVMGDGDMLRLTPARLGQLRQSQQRIVTRNRLERNVRVPQPLLALIFAILEKSVSEDFLVHPGRYHADLVVCSPVFAAGIVHGMDVQFRGCRLAGQLAQSLYEFLL